MPVRVLQWDPLPGQNLPEPRLTDDSESFPPQVVANARQWLTAVRPELEAKRKPADLVLNLRNSTVTLQGVPQTKIQSFRFQHGTVEILLRDKKSMLIIARYHYLSARCPDGRIILGERLCIHQDRIV